MDIRNIQGYANFFMTIFLVIILYGYIIHLYRSEKKGEKDYEKYGNIALDDEVTSTPIEDGSDTQSKSEEKNR
ncbi:Cytochrome c oxidase subunit CcoQ [hydrothermal vent metagenome]|uniref:Cytochrome c oxidase subunit CcoQ n=1 Tax=hydrothermal vent metagenome TaxID=652676 RepID=A0A1W1B9P0_9ZZZZ